MRKLFPNALLSSKAAAFLWLMALALALTVTVFGLVHTAPTSNILALLPEDSQNQQINKINKSFVEHLENRVIYALKGSSQIRDSFLRELEKSPALKRISGSADQHYQNEFLDLLIRHRLAFIGHETMKRLQTSEGTEQLLWAKTRLLSPFEGVSAKELSVDPLLIARSTRYEAITNSPITIKDNWLTLSDGKGESFWFIECEFASSASTSERIAALNTAENYLSRHYPQAELLKAGIIFYSELAQNQAKRDISVLGSISIVGLFLIFWFSFHSLIPFCLCVLALSTGMLMATAATLTVFGTIHTATLVMSVSLIGISADYTTYFIVEQMRGHHSAWETKKLLTPILLHACITSCTAYLIMLFAPMPGLRQFALFSATGLFSACLTVLLWYPYLLKNFKTKPIPVQWLFNAWLALWKNKAGPICVFVLLTFVAITGLPKLLLCFDISKLQQLDTTLKAQETKLMQLLRNDMSQHWFIITGKDEENLLANAQRLSENLLIAKKHGFVKSFDSLPIISQKQQAELLTHYTHAEQLMRKDLTQLGITLPEPSSPLPLSLKDFSMTSYGNALNGKLLHLDDGSWAFIQTAVTDQPEQMALIANNCEGTYWYSRKAEFSNVFSNLRELVLKLMCVSFIAVGLLFVRMVGLKKAFAAVASSVGSLLFAVSCSALIGIPFNLFSLFALILVFGIGIDYVVFFAKLSDSSVSVCFAVSIAMMTTLMSLGILAFSSTAAIANFGLTLFLGILGAFILAPMVLTIEK